MNSYKKIYIGILILLSILMTTACEKQPLKIGFIGSLTSKNSQLSIDARNAISLGIEQVNANGGINGRLIEFIVKDDGADPEVALQMHDAFIDENVSLVLGHMTSNMAEPVLKSQSEKLLFVSPTMGSSSLLGLDDYFIRTFPLTNNQAEAFFKLIDELKVKNALILYDIMNADYTEKMAKHAEAINPSLSNIQLKLVPFDSRVDDLKSIARQIAGEKDIELVLLVSQAIDTAVISQVIKKEKPEIILCSVFWSMTEDLLLNGGDAIEKMYLIGLSKSETPSEAYIQFRADFFDKYKYEPSGSSILAYDAFNVLLEGIKNAKDDSPKNVKKAILDKKEFLGLEESFEIDNFGDNNRTFGIYQLIENSFVPLYN